MEAPHWTRESLNMQSMKVSILAVIVILRQLALQVLASTLVPLQSHLNARGPGRSSSTSMCKDNT